MNRVSDIDRYLRAYFATQQRDDIVPTDNERHPFITISRQAGTGGHELADMILRVFADQPDKGLFGDWQVYDRTVCEIVAKDRAFASSFDSLLDEEYRSRANDFFHQMVRSTVDQKMVMNRVFLVVRALAGMGKAVIVGRGGSHVTADLPMGVSIRLVAPEGVRTERMMRLHGISEREARAGGRRRDADRARMLRSHFGADIDDPTGYDVTWNLGSTSYEEIAWSMVELVRSRADRR